MTSDTMLGLAWYTFATCCSHRVLSSAVLNSELIVMACIAVLLKLACNTGFNWFVIVTMLVL